MVKKGLARKGISEALVLVLIIVVAIAIVGIVGAMLLAYPGMLGAKADMIIDKVDLVADGQSIVVVRNTGNVRIDRIDSATVACDGTQMDIADHLAAPLDPGKSSTAVFQLTDISAGQRCTITITGTAANGANVAASATAYVRP
ncbi:MAG: hypothetical protein QXG25_02915 [Nitrososphaerota archaeon]